MAFTLETMPHLPLSLAQAIARMEGWYASGKTPNRCQRNNNPGDIEFDHFSQAYGASHGDPRFAVFPTAAMGWACLNALLSIRYKSLTLQQAIYRYAPPSENQTEGYLDWVCEWTGRKPTDVLANFLIAT